MSATPEHVAGTTFHGRHGAVRHSLRHRVDYVLIDPEAPAGPALFSRNRLNLASVHDRDHGGAPGAGRGADWVREVLWDRDTPNAAGLTLRLLTQPRFLGYSFNPVSFWLAYDGAALVAVIAEVNNTFGDRHSYLCHLPGYAPITARDEITATKVFHVSPFQQIAGAYRFTFDITPEAIAIRIALQNGDGTLVATLNGARKPLTNRALLSGALRRPFGPLRTTALIYWHALRLRLKGAPYRPRPIPPSKEVS